MGALPARGLRHSNALLASAINRPSPAWINRCRPETSWPSCPDQREAGGPWATSGLSQRRHHDALRSTRRPGRPGQRHLAAGAGAGFQASPPGTHPGQRAGRRSPIFIGRQSAASTPRRTPRRASNWSTTPAMTEGPRFEHLAAAVSARHGLIHALVEHRGGAGAAGEALVLGRGPIRRGPAQRGCQELLEALKHEAPFGSGSGRHSGPRMKATPPLKHSSEQGGRRSSWAQAPCRLQAALLRAGSPASRSAALQRTDAGGRSLRLPSTDALKAQPFCARDLARARGSRLAAPNSGLGRRAPSARARRTSATRRPSNFHRRPLEVTAGRIDTGRSVATP